MREISILANDAGMAGNGLEEDTLFVRALVDWAALAPSAVAARAGLAATTITRPHKGVATTKMGRETLAKLRAAFPDFPGFHQMRPDLPAAPRQLEYVPVPILPSFAGMGGGGTGEGDQETALISRALVEDALRARPEELLLIEVRGDSNEPQFLHGDQVLIDGRDTNPAQPGFFALWDGDAYVLKLVERVPQRQGRYRVFSANQRYSEYEVGEEDIRIMGRPVWFSRRI